MSEVPFAPQAASPPPPAQQAQALRTPPGLIEGLERQAEHFPELVFQHAGQLRRPDQRERLVRSAFLTAASRQREVALRYLEEMSAQAWIGDVPFADAVALAAAAAGPWPAAARRLLLASAARNPSLAIRQVPAYIDLPFGREVFEEAALAAAGEVVLLAAGESALSAGIREALASSERREVSLLGELVARPGLDGPQRSRVAALVRQIAGGRLTLEAATKAVAIPARYFALLIDDRLAASGASARALDRAIEQYALMLCRSFQDSPAGSAPVLGSFSARDLYLLLAYGKAEQEDTFFAGIFDRHLLGKLRALPGPRPLAGLIERTTGLQFRAFASAALQFNRWEAFLQLESGEANRADLVGRLVRGIEASGQPLEDAVTVSEIAELSASRPLLRLLRDVLDAELSRASGNPRVAALYGVLSGRIAQKLGSADGPGARFEPYLRGTDVLDSTLLFDATGTCLQRHFFYYDQDGLESFQTFLATYENDPAWAVERLDGAVRISAADGGRRIVIYANAPFDLLDPANRGMEDEAARRDAQVARLTASHSSPPPVLVHRGHSYHVDKTIDHVTPATRLLFLGSCRSLGKVHAALEVAQGAHVFASRGIGTAGVNDPLMKSLNDELLRAGSSIEWPRFWAAQEARLGRVAYFRDYLPPHRNPASILLRAYYRALDDLQ